MSEGAAWVQAIGSILAIGVAIWVPSNIHLNETRRRENEIRLKGQAIALLIKPLLLVIDRQIERERTPRRDGPIAIEVPKELLTLSKDFWQMGEAGGYVMQLIGTLQTHNRLVEDTISLPIDMEEEDRLEYSRLYRERLKLARDCIGNASSSIDDLLR